MAKLGVRWTKIAFADLEKAFEFIESDEKAEAAKEVVLKILSGVEQVRTFPESGRSGRVEGTRELVVSKTPFIIIFRLKSGAIEILSILHHARKWS